MSSDTQATLPIEVVQPPSAPSEDDFFNMESAMLRLRCRSAAVRLERTPGASKKARDDSTRLIVKIVETEKHLAKLDVPENIKARLTCSIWRELHEEVERFLKQRGLRMT